MEFNHTNNYTHCNEIISGICQDIDLETCTPLPRVPLQISTPNFSSDYYELQYDENGCFMYEALKATHAFKNYSKFSNIMGTITLVLASLGLIGNVTSIVVLSQQEMVNCFNQLLIALNTCDSLFLIVAIMEAIRTDYESTYFSVVGSHLIYPFVHYPFYRILMCAGIYMMIGVGIERYMAVCRPHHYRELQVKPNRSFVYILPSLLLATLINLPKFFEIEPYLRCIDLNHCGCGLEERYFMKPTNLRVNKDYIIYYVNWTNITLTGIIPFVILMFLNISIYNGMKKVKENLNKKAKLNPRQRNAGSTVASCSEIVDPSTLNSTETRRKKRASQQSKECNLAIILICTVATFFICHLPRVLYQLYEAINIHNQSRCMEERLDFMPLWYLYSIVLANMLLILNSSFNLPIYLFVGKSFRAIFMRIFKLDKLIAYINRNTGKTPQCDGSPATEMQTLRA